MPRHQTDAVQCPLGSIADLSGTGMRVMIAGRCVFKVGQTLPIRLRTPQGSLAVAARIVWKKKVGLFRDYELGFHFDGLEPNQVVALAAIARFGFVAGNSLHARNESPSKEEPAIGDPSAVEAGLVLSEYYQRLGLANDATPSDIKAAYRRLARQYHPDIAPGPENQRRFVELREAYDLLRRHTRQAG